MTMVGKASKTERLSAWVLRILLIFMLLVIPLVSYYFEEYTNVTVKVTKIGSEKVIATMLNGKQLELPNNEYQLFDEISVTINSQGEVVKVK